MKTNGAHLTGWNTLILSLLALLLFGTNAASAQIRVKATVHTSYGAVRIDSGHNERYRAPHHHLNYSVSRHDRQIARRLARYAGVSRREILRLRSQGYRWAEIGYWLDVPRQVVRAARHRGSWRRFLQAERRYKNCGLRYHRHGDRYNDG